MPHAVPQTHMTCNLKAPQIYCKKRISAKPVSIIVFDDLKTKIKKKKNDPERLETDQLNAWYTNNYLESKPYRVIPFQNSRTRFSCRGYKNN